LQISDGAFLACLAPESQPFIASRNVRFSAQHDTNTRPTAILFFYFRQLKTLKSIQGQISNFSGYPTHHQQAGNYFVAQPWFDHLLMTFL
jgi:hypothetical protein